MAFILGLTGGIGSGKSVASQHFEDLGIEVIDTDLIAREVVQPHSPTLNNIVLHFGNRVINHAGELDRKALRKIIFDAPKEKQWLENLLHPLIRTRVNDKLAHIQSPYGVLVSPLLFESKQHHKINRTLVIDCPEEIQQQRTSQRDDISIKDIQDIMATQLSREERNQQADDIIENSGSIEDLQQAIEHYHYALLDNIHAYY